jgi:hypothetical protein
MTHLTRGGRPTAFLVSLLAAFTVVAGNANAATLVGIWQGVAVNPADGLFATVTETVTYSPVPFDAFGDTFQYSFLVSNLSVPGRDIDEFAGGIGNAAAARAGGFRCDFLAPVGGVDNCLGVGTHPYIENFFAPAGWDFSIQDNSANPGVLAPTAYLAAWSTDVNIPNLDNLDAPAGAAMAPNQAFPFIVYSHFGPFPGGAFVDPPSSTTPFLIIDNLDNTVTFDLVQLPEPAAWWFASAGISALLALRLHRRPRAH